LKVEILGTRGNIPLRAPRYARHSGVLIDGAILLDLGEASYLRRRPRMIFITHLHPDHAVLQKVPSVPLYVPERTPRAPTATVITRTVHAGAYRITPVPTQHAVNARSVGYLVEKGRKRVFYSSDLFAIRPRYHARLKRLDLVITDGSFMRRGGLMRVDPATKKKFGHGGIPDLVGFFSRFTRRIVFTHFGSWFYRDISRSIRQIGALGNGVQVGAARDGMVIDV